MRMSCELVLQLESEEDSPMSTGGVVDVPPKDVAMSSSEFKSTASVSDHMTAFQQHVESIRVGLQFALTRYLEVVQLSQSHALVLLFRLKTVKSKTLPILDRC